MGSTILFAPGLERTLRQCATLAVIAAAAITVYLAGQAAATVKPSPDPHLVQVSSTTLLPGQTVTTYQMTVTNLGETTSVVVPAPIAPASVTGAVADTGSYADGVWSIGSLDSGATATLNLTAE